MNLTTRQKEILTGLFGIVFFFGGFLLAELSFRVVQLARYGVIDTIADAPMGEQAPGKAARNRSPFFHDEKSGLRLPYPNQRLGAVRINNLGFRGPDISTAKPKGTFRVAFLGSSTTYNAEAEEGANWPEQTAKALRRELTACELDFINAGLPGFSTDAMQRYWEARVRHYDVDLVMILPGDMTSDIQKAAAHAGYNTGQHIRKSWLAKHSLLWEKVEKNAAVVRAQRSAFTSEGKFLPDLPALAAAFRERLANLEEAVVGDGRYVAVLTISSHVRENMDRRAQLVAADSALFYMPYISIPTLISAQGRYNEIIRSVVGTSQAQLVADEDMIPADNIHFADSRHFKAAGSEVMARRIASGLLHSREFLDFILEHSAGCMLSSDGGESNHRRSAGIIWRDRSE